MGVNKGFQIQAQTPQTMLTHLTTLKIHDPHLPRLSSLPPLHKQNMHTSIRQHHERRPKHRQARGIHLQRTVVEAEGAQDSCTGNLDIESVFAVYQTQGAHFVYDEAFEAVVEDGELFGC